MADKPKSFGPTLRRNMAGAFAKSVVEVLESRPALAAALVIGALTGAALVIVLILRMRPVRQRSEASSASGP